MIAYQREGLDALLTRETAREWHENGLLSAEKWQAIQDRYPVGFYMPNVFVRIGLAVFCLVLLLAAMGLAVVLIEPDLNEELSLLGLFGGGLCVALLEWWAVRSARHYGSGIDEMLLYVGVVTILGSIFNLMDYTTDALVYYCIAWPFLVAGAVRYLDRLMTAAAFCCSFGIVALVIDKLPNVAIYLLPFAGMAFSAGAYFFARRGQRRYGWRHGHGLLVVVEILALVAFYFSGNYGMVQQVAEKEYGLMQPPVGWFFWLFTFAVPALYLWQGLRRKERLLLDLGLAAAAAALFTFRHYYHVLPLAWAAVAAGAILFVAAYFSIDYLRKNKGAYTYEPESKTSLLQEIEEQLLEQTIAAQSPPVPPAKPEGFGGGQFGGGGAGSDF